MNTKFKISKFNWKTVRNIFFILFFVILFFIKGLMSISLGTDETKTADEIKNVIEANLDKYINYKTLEENEENEINEEKQRTLVQYNVKVGIEKEKDGISPIKENTSSITFNKIDDKFPYEVNTIIKSTELTNGNTAEKANCEYNSNTGTLTIKTSNQNEKGEPIQKDSPNSDEKDEYIIIAKYDTYTEQNVERELGITTTVDTSLFSEDEDINISSQDILEVKASENIGELTSVNYTTDEIYNGYIKSNNINGTQYNTEYTENLEIQISEKENCENVEVLENNSFIREYKNRNDEINTEDIINNNNLVYKSTKIYKNNMEEILGEEGTIQIIDPSIENENENVIATINKDSEFQEDGSITITYEKALENVIIKTSKVEKEGILNIENKKEIKSTMKDMNVKIKTVAKINETEKVNIVEFKDSTTNVNFEIENQNWTNKEQNEVVFDVQLDSNSNNKNMFKNPSIKIELPEEVEKVLLGHYSIVYANGLELQEPQVQKNENGNYEIVANIKGAQTEYKENNLELKTQIQIPATIILKKNIEDSVKNINLIYTNQYNINSQEETGSKTKEIELKNYEEKNTEIEEKQYKYETAKNTTNEIITKNNLKLEVAPVKGDTTLNNGDTVYEGEYIKYNIKVTNISEETVDNVKVVGSIPEGVTYGELETDYFEYMGKYEYNFDEEAQSKEIEIGTLEAGESFETFYEVKANDLEEGTSEKSIASEIKAYESDQEVANYVINNTIKPADVQAFVVINKSGGSRRWNYFIKLTSKETKEVDVKIKIPEAIKISDFASSPDGLRKITEEDLDENGNVSMKLMTNNEGIQGLGYAFYGNLDYSIVNEQAQGDMAELNAVATINSNGIDYKSNEARLSIEYQSVSINMTSDNEGEKVKYQEEIDYEITVTNTGATYKDSKVDNNISVRITDFLPEDVDPISVTYINAKGEEVTEDIIKRKDENGENLGDIDIYTLVPEKESRVINVKTKAGFVEKETKIENSATASGTVKEKTSNTITHTILPYNYDENQGETPNPPSNPTTPENPSNPTTPSNPETPGSQGGEGQENQNNEKYNISGLVWIDANKDGQRQSDEKLLKDITVMLVEIGNGTSVKSTAKTSSSGTYNFPQVEKGEYIVIFQYDTSRYGLTTYQKEGVSSQTNSDVANKSMNINNNKINVGVTDVITLESSVSNIDMGLVENKVLDLKVDKYISKVTLQTKKQVKELTYNQAKLAKIEIPMGEIENAKVTVEYKIILTNVGDATATVDNIIDVLPDGMDLAEGNRNWTKGANGKVTNSSMANTNIESGKSIETTIVLTKTLTGETTGTFTNEAQIKNVSTQAGIKEKDTNNNASKAEIIISIKTGIIAQISIGIMIAVIALTVILLVYKFGIAKIIKTSTFIALFVCVLFSNISNKYSYSYEGVQGEELAKRVFVPDSVEFSNYDQDQTFQNSSGSANVGECQDAGVTAKTGKFTATLDHCNESWSYDSTETHISVDLKKLNETADMKLLDANTCILGPFSFSCTWKENGKEFDAGEEYIVEVSGGGSATPCDANGNDMKITGSTTFYLKIPKSAAGQSISSVKLRTKAKMKIKYTKHYNGYGVYVYSESYQSIEYEYYYVPSSEQDVEVTEQREAEIEWTNFNGILEFEKVDKDNPNKKQPNVKFSVSGPGYNGTVVTDENGKVIIENIKPGNYTVTEVENPNYYYPDMENMSMTVPSGGIGIFTMSNIKQTGNLKITKLDPDSKRPLAGVTFSITGPDFSGTFTTDSNGFIELFDLKVGTYTITELSVGENYYHEVDDEYITWETPTESGKGRTFTVEVTRRSSIYTDGKDITQADMVTVYNKRKYVDLSGYVWEDKKYQLGKQEYDNSLYKDGQLDAIDELLSGINVELKDSSGNTVESTQTDSSGNYIFEKVLINDIKGFYIEFEYNGLDYENVDVGIGEYPNSSIVDDVSYGEKPNSSRASEGSNRPEFNDSFSTITKEDSQDANTGKALNGNYNITYETGEYESKLLYRNDRDKSKYNYGYGGNQSSGKPVNGIDQQYLIRANTKNAYQNGYLDKIKTAEEIRKMAIDEITSINLGIRRRKEIDLSLVKDLQSVRVDINNAEHVYNYADRYNPSLYVDENVNSRHDLEPAVKFGQKYSTTTYTRALYASDVYYNPDNVDEKDKLQVNATYKIGIKNTSSELKAIINEIEDYYDEKYDIVSVGKEIDNHGNVTEESKVAYREVGSGNGYKKILIEPNLEVSSTEGDIYIQFSIRRERVVDIIDNLRDNNIETKLDNIAEIKSYSVKDEANNSYAAIDIDSQPGNVVVQANGEINETFEDDTDKAPGLKLVLQEERKVSGKIFIDDIITENGENPDELLQGKVRQGSGAYEEGEKGLAGATVRLIDTTKNGTNEERTTDIWDDNERKWKTAIETTDENGEYEIGGFIPENYEIVFTWGDKTYKVQDYKSTIVDKESYDAKGENNLEWYKDEFKQKYPNIEWDTTPPGKEIRRSDAVDDYGMRGKIDKQSSMITNANKEVIENYEGQIELEDGTKENLITKIDSNTPVFRVNLEYSRESTTVSDEYELNSDGSIKMNGSYAVKKPEYANFIKSIDLGIVERAKQALELTKRVKDAKITLANGSILTEVQMEDGKIVNDPKYAIYLPATSAKEAQINFEVDEEIVQNSLLEIEYGLQVENISELEYLNEDFYKYGKGHGEKLEDLVKLSAQNTIDYLDNDISTNNDEELGDIIQETTAKNELINPKGLLENSNEMKDLLDETTRVLLINKQLTKETSPINNKIAEASLLVSKLLPNISTEEIYIENSAEIVKVHKTGGSTLETKPGNYIPSKQEHEYDDAKAEVITVIPPTGRSLKYITYTLLAIGSLAILATGVILIKKYILK